MFNAIIGAYFEHLSLNQPGHESAWYGPWDMLLNAIFPSERAYAVKPQTRIINESKEYRIPDFVLEVVKISSALLPYIL